MICLIFSDVSLSEDPLEESITCLGTAAQHGITSLAQVSCNPPLCMDVPGIITYFIHIYIFYSNSTRRLFLEFQPV